MTSTSPLLVINMTHVAKVHEQWESDSFKQDGQSYAAEISCAASPKGPGISWSQRAPSSDLPLYRGLVTIFVTQSANGFI